MIQQGVVTGPTSITGIPFSIAAPNFTPARTANGPTFVSAKYTPSEAATYRTLAPACAPASIAPTLTCNGVFLTPH